MYLDSDNAFYSVKCGEKPRNVLTDFGMLPGVRNSYVMIVTV